MTFPDRSETDEAKPLRRSPNAERYLLEADNLRRRQLRAALLHGTARTWRERTRVWPAVVAGIALVAIIIAAIAVYGAFQLQKRINEQQNRPPATRTTGAAAPLPDQSRSDQGVVFRALDGAT